MLVIPLGVRDEQTLHQPADHILPGFEQQTEVIAHQAITIQLERLTLAKIQQSDDKCPVIALVKKTVCRLLPRLMTW